MSSRCGSKNQKKIEDEVADATKEEKRKFRWKIVEVGAAVSVEIFQRSPKRRRRIVDQESDVAMERRRKKLKIFLSIKNIRKL